jgi:hypothetical protein
VTDGFHGERPDFDFFMMTVAACRNMPTSPAGRLMERNHLRPDFLRKRSEHLTLLLPSTPLHLPGGMLPPWVVDANHMILLVNFAAGIESNAPQA